LSDTIAAAISAADRGYDTEGHRADVGAGVGEIRMIRQVRKRSLQPESRPFRDAEILAYTHGEVERARSKQHTDPGISEAADGRDVAVELVRPRNSTGADERAAVKVRVRRRIVEVARPYPIR
jgi:hypothetical protein